MADAVPACDVLCEAMEYLSKLGSNLRVRSENLKEKRLKKEKLRNVHAVQKAAGKVLLICELSKKSIENVETGVKKILTQIDLSQASIDCGGINVENPKISKSDVKYKHFQHGSRKLKIRDNVNIEHYTSVQVLAKPMSTLTQEKYPVYHDCKLYRIRRKKHKERALSGSSEVNNENKLNVNESTDVNTEDNLNNLDISILEEKNNSSDTGEVQVEKKLKTLKNNVKDGSKENMDTTSNSLHTECSSETKEKTNESSSKEEVKKKSSPKTKTYKHIKIMESSDSDTDIKNSQEKHTKIDLDIDKNESEYKNTCNDGSKEKNNENKAEDDNILSTKVSQAPIANEEKNETDVSVEIVDYKRKSNECSENKSNNEQETKMTKERSNDINTQMSDSVIITQDEVGDDNMSEHSEQTVILEKESNTENMQVDDSTVTDFEKHSNIEETNYKKNCKVTPVDSAETEEHSNQNTEEEKSSTAHDVTKPSLESDNSQGSMDSKSYIKCVNINKLLRDDKKPKINESIEIIDSDSDNEKGFNSKKNRQRDKNKLNRIISVYKNKFKLNKKRNKESECSEENIKNKNDEDYWLQKRKEVKSFKPKEFVINITQLPKFTSEYLYKNQLKKITQNGLSLCEMPTDEENGESKENKSESNPKESTKTTIVATSDINVVKNALLDESDSDTGNKLKTALLNDSGLEKNTKDDQNCSNSRRDSENKSSECEKSEKRNKSKSRSKTPPSQNKLSDNNLDTNKIKSSLLNDSTDDSKTPTKKRKRESEELSSPSSKRKHIMESMHAKKMLLTYSSSSDTDDEQLRNALKEIRDTLLKGDSSDEGKNEKNKQLNLEDDAMQSTQEQEEKVKEEESSECGTSAKDTTSQIDENTEERSNTCSEKVRRK